MADQLPLPAAEPPPPSRDPGSKGWRVQPAPDGRGAPKDAKPPMVPRSRRFIAILAGLLVLNLVLSFITGRPAGRERVPYQPFFVGQLQAGNVRDITSQAESLEGDLKKAATYDPPGSAKPLQVTRFKTQVPAFINTASLTQLLASKNVVINAEPPDSGRSFLSSLLL